MFLINLLSHPPLFIHRRDLTIENIFILSPIENGNGTGLIFRKGLKVYAAYPDEATVFQNPAIIEKITSLHTSLLEKSVSPDAFTDDFLQANTKALTIESLTILSILLPQKHILGLVIEKNNPYDYRNELIRLLLEYFLKIFAENHKEKTLNTLLLTLFVDLRKYDDELTAAQEVQNQIIVIGNVPMIKAFLYGIDNAGKSSLMRFLATGKYDDNYFPPTKKFRITNIKLKSGAKLVAWDMPGQRIFRADWLRGAQASNILIFVLDVADTNRYEEAKQALWNMLNLYELQNLPLLFMVNKTDLMGTLPTKDAIISSFNLSELKQRPWTVIFASIAKNIGIDECIQWVESQIDQMLLKQGLVVVNNPS